MIVKIKDYNFRDRNNFTKTTPQYSIRKYTISTKLIKLQPKKNDVAPPNETTN